MVDPVTYRELLLGCGYKKEKRIVVPGTPSQWQNLTTVDVNPRCRPDVVADLNTEGWYCTTGIERYYAYDEIHAYEVLEHLGSQGDFQHFFRTFQNLWDLLKDGGYLCATTPSRHSPWLWGDPGHRRAILPESLVFLDQTEYTRQVDKTSMSDYRECYTADFRIVHSQENLYTHTFVLQAIRASRLSMPESK